MLIVFGGLPGGGKTTLSQAIAARYGAMCRRVDVIEQAMRNAKAVTWQEVIAREYDLCHAPHLTVDTAWVAPEDASAAIAANKG